MSLLLAIVALGVLILVHELGHFLTAKFFGIGVERFSLGFGPVVFSKKVGETEYALSLIPLGGYVKLLGEEDPSSISPEQKDKAFAFRSLKEKTAVVLAGPMANILFATLLLFATGLIGYPVLLPEVGKIVPKSPAETAGLRPGDLIVKVNGKKIESWQDIVEIVHKNPNTELAVTVKRGEKLITFRLRSSEKIVIDILGRKKRIGLIGIVASGRTKIKRLSPLSALIAAFERTWEMIYLTVLGIIKIIERAIPLKSIGGPILIVQMAKQQAKLGFVNFLFFTALISVNLGVINLLPIPVLDGGHLVFFGIEAVRGKPISVRKKEIAQQVGLFILILIMILAFYNDILRLMGR